MYLGLMKLRFPLLYFHSGLGMTSWSLETLPTAVTVHRQPAKSPSWALESFASSLIFPLTTKFSWSIRIRTTPVRLHHELVTYFDVRMAPAAESVGSVALPRRSKRRR